MALLSRLRQQHSIVCRRLCRVLANPTARSALRDVAGGAATPDFGNFVHYVSSLLEMRDGKGIAATTLSPEALKAVQLRQQQHDADIELLEAEASAARCPVTARARVKRVVHGAVCGGCSWRR
jgi:hypothetical protein